MTNPLQPGINDQTTVFQNDPFGAIKQERKNPSPPPRDVNFFHTRADTDSSWGAGHHTIGLSHNQASAGDHNHDGATSRKVGQGLNITVAVTGLTADQKISNLLTALQKVMDITTV